MTVALSRCVDHKHPDWCDPRHCEEGGAGFLHAGTPLVHYATSSAVTDPREHVTLRLRQNEDHFDEKCHHDLSHEPIWCEVEVENTCWPNRSALGGGEHADVWMGSADLRSLAASLVRMADAIDRLSG